MPSHYLLPIAARPLETLGNPQIDLMEVLRQSSADSSKRATKAAASPTSQGFFGNLGDFFSDPRVHQALITLGQGIAGEGNPVNAIGDAGTNLIQGRAETELLGRLLAGEDPSKVFGGETAQVLLPENRQNLLDTFSTQRQLEQRDTALEIQQQEADTGVTKVEGQLELGEGELALREFLETNKLEDADADRELRELLGLERIRTTERGQDIGLEQTRIRAEATVTAAGQRASNRGVPIIGQLNAELNAIDLEFMGKLEGTALSTLTAVGANPNEFAIATALDPVDRAAYLQQREAARLSFDEERAAPADATGVTLPGSGRTSIADLEAANNAVGTPGATSDNPRTVTEQEASSDISLRGQWIIIVRGDGTQIPGFISPTGQFIPQTDNQ